MIKKIQHSTRKITEFSQSVFKEVQHPTGEITEFSESVFSSFFFKKI